MNTPHPRRGTAFVLIGIVLYLLEFVGFALAGGYPSNEPGTPLDQIPIAYAGLAGGTGFLVGWMGVVLTGRILLIIGLRSVIGRSVLMDWAVMAAVVSVAIEIVSVAAMAAGAALVADGASLDAVLAADRIAWTTSGGAVAPAGVAALLTAVAMWRSTQFPRVLSGLGIALGAVILVSGLLNGAPSTYPLASTLSIGVFGWFLWALWTGVLLVRRVRGVPGPGPDPINNPPAAAPSRP